MASSEKNISPLNKSETSEEDQHSHGARLADRILEQETEMESLYEQLEDAISRANSATMEAEVAHLELDQIFDAVSDAMWVIDTDYNILYINAQFLKLLGRTKPECTGKKCYTILDNILCRSKACPIKQIRKNDSRVETELSLEFEPGRKRPFLLTAAPLLGLTNDIVGVVEQYKDITKRKQYEEALQRQATLDGLTQLANRRLFEQRLNHEWQRLKREKKPLSIILCDVDFFKLYNDHYGHQMGDTCLQAVAKCLKTSVRRPADLPARYGGEEFVVILPNTPLEGSLHVAEEIRKNLQALTIEHARSEVSPHVSLSLGVATTVPDNLHDHAELVQAADLALYAAKEAGRNRVVRGSFPPVSDDHQKP